MVSTREPSFKVRNLRRDPRASVCAIPDTFFGKWIQAEGTATIVSPLRDCEAERSRRTNRIDQAADLAAT